jgi:integrase
MDDVDPCSIKDARAVDAKYKVQKKERRLFDVRPDPLTFNKVAEWYTGLESVKGLSSYNRIKIAIGHFNAVFGRRVADAVVTSELVDYFQRRIDSGIAKSTASVELAIIKGMVNKAFDDRKVDADVIRSFRKVKPKVRRGAYSRRRTVTIEEYLKLLDTAPRHFKPMLIVAMSTGMRPGEIRRLRWQQVDRKTGFIRLGAEDTKEKQPKAIPINHHVKAVLDGIVRRLDREEVFSFGGEPITGPKGCYGALRGACKRAGIPYGQKHPEGLTMHDFRRTVKTNMLEAGVDKTYRDKILGHALEGMDRVYINPSEDTLHHAMSRYTAWLDGKIELCYQSGYQARAENA